MGGTGAGWHRRKVFIKGPEMPQHQAKTCAEKSWEGTSTAGRVGKCAVNLRETAKMTSK